MACALLEQGGRVLLVRRAEHGLLGGLWELPSVEVADGENPRPPLARAVERRIGAPVVVERKIAAVRRMLTHRVLELEAHRARLRSRPPRRRHEGRRWVAWDALGSAGMATAFRELLGAARAGRPEARGSRAARRRSRPGKAPEVPDNP